MIYSVLSNNKDLINNFLKTFSYHNNKYENLIITVDDKTSNWNDMNNVIKSYSDKIRILRLTDIERYSVQTLGLGNYFTFIKVCPIQAKLLIPFYFKWALSIDKFFMMDDDILVNYDIGLLDFNQCDGGGTDNTAQDFMKCRNLVDQLLLCNELLNKKFVGDIKGFPRFVVCAFFMTVYEDYAEYIFRFFNSTKIYEYIKLHSNNFNLVTTNKNPLYPFEENCLNIYIVSHSKKFALFGKNMVFQYWGFEPNVKLYQNKELVKNSLFIHTHLRNKENSKLEWSDYYFPELRQISDEICPIVYCFDKNYIPFVKQSIKSVLKYNKNVKIILIVDEYIEDFEDFKNFEQYTIKNSLDQIPAFNLHGGTDRLTKFTYARLLIPEILKNYNRVLYLDGDILCTSNIEFLLKIIPPVIAGVKDINADTHCSALNYTKYINAGVLLMNLEELRNKNFTQKALSYNFQNFPKNTQWCHDQSIINDILQNDILLLSNYYNYQLHWAKKFSEQQITELSEANKLIHFTGRLNYDLFKNLII